MGRGNTTKYWVKWKGHKAKTLEPKSHLKDCPDLVKQFEDGINKAKANPRPSRATANIAVGEDRESGDMYMMTPDPEVYVIDMENQFMVSRHHRFHDENTIDTHHTPSCSSAQDSEAVAQLLKQQQRVGTLTNYFAHVPVPITAAYRAM